MLRYLKLNAVNRLLHFVFTCGNVPTFMKQINFEMEGINVDLEEYN